MPEAGDVADRASRLRHPSRLFADARDVAGDVEPPHGGLALAGVEPHLRKRYAQFDTPSCGIDVRLGIPHTVIIGARVGIVVQRDVPLHARRVHFEEVPGLMIVAGIEQQRDAIAVGNIVAPALPRANRAGIGSLAADRDIEVARVVRHLHGRAFGSALHAVRLDLNEIVDPLGLHPCLIVEAAVDAWHVRGVNPQRAEVLANLLGYVRLCTCVRRLRLCSCRHYRYQTET